MIGILGIFSKNPNVAYGIGSLLILLNFGYNISVGPLCEYDMKTVANHPGYTIVAELPSTRVRPQTIVIARIVYILCGIVCNQLAPRMLSAQAWNWGALCGWFWLGTNLISITYCFFRLPETKNRTYGELDILFVSAFTLCLRGISDFLGEQDIRSSIRFDPGQR